MTLFINIGRRVPKAWHKRMANSAMGLINFQQNLWIIITQSIGLAKRKAKEAKTLDFVVTKKMEDEDLYYNIEWICILIRGTKEQEQEEMNDMNSFYVPLGKIFKKDMPPNDDMKKHFKTKLLNLGQVDEAYKKGYGAVTNSNLANKLLEMGILTHIEWVQDFDTREVAIPK